MSNKNKRFNYCCDNRNKVKYSIKHNPRPIDLIPEFRECIDNLLWYIPGISSVQSEENYLIDKKEYSEAVFELILDEMGIDYNNDVKVVRYTSIDKNDINQYEKFICTNCQKLIFTKYRYETNLRAMLRHFRNSIAHGNFIIIDDLAIFNDEIKKNVLTAFIKIKIKELNNILKCIVNENGITLEKIIARVLINLGYSFDINERFDRSISDMIVEKNNKRYAIEFKITQNRVIGYNHSILEQLLKSVEIFKNENLIPVFIFDKNLVTDKCKKLLKEQGIIILDKKNIRDLAQKTVSTIE